jgi:hypothetical protein
MDSEVEAWQERRQCTATRRPVAAFPLGFDVRPFTGSQSWTHKNNKRLLQCVLAGH